MYIVTTYILLDGEVMYVMKAIKILALSRLSQHYIGQKMTFWHFSNFCRRKFFGMITYCMNLDVLPHDFCKLQPPELYKKVKELFCQAEKLFYAEI